MKYDYRIVRVFNEVLMMKANGKYKHGARYLASTAKLQKGDNHVYTDIHIIATFSKMHEAGALYRKISGSPKVGTLDSRLSESENSDPEGRILSNPAS